VLERHGQVFVALAEQVGAPGGRRRRALDLIEVELDNIRAAFGWQLEKGRPEPVARAIGESWWFWWTRGHVKEGKQWSERCLQSADLGQEARARALGARAMFALWSGEYELAVPAFREAAETGRSTGDRTSVAYADIGLGLVRSVTASMQEGTELIRRGIAAFEELGDEAGATTGLAALSWVQGITRRFDAGDDVLRRAVDRARSSGSEVDIGITEAALAQLHLSRGETGPAVDLLATSLTQLAAARHIGSTILTLEVIAELGLAHGESWRSATVLGATAAIRSTMGTRVPPAAAARLDQLRQQAGAHLGDDLGRAIEAGSAMGLADAVEQGRAVLEEIRPTGA
jgi:hypothetical protein